MKKINKLLVFSSLMLTPSLLIAGSFVQRNVADMDKLFQSKNYNIKTDNTLDRYRYPDLRKEDYIESAKNAPDSLSFMEKQIKMQGYSHGVNSDVLMGIVAEVFQGEEFQTAKVQSEVINFLSLYANTLSEYLNRYDGNYTMALEATAYGHEPIDYLYLRYGDEWLDHLEDIYTYTGGNSTETVTVDSFSAKVLAYLEVQ